MEGLRLLPWWQEAIRRGVIGDRSKCETCMTRLDPQTRQINGCGYLPPPVESLRPFVSTAAPLGCDVEVTVCPGYSTNLPETIEVARARLHWSKGGPMSIGIRDWSDSALATGIEILEGASNECQAWTMQHPDKAGA